MKLANLPQRLVKLPAVLGSAALIVALAGCAGAGVKTGQYVDDSAITTKVKTALIKAENLPSSSINVSTLKGEVQLSGFTRSETDKQRAAVIARDIEGVRSVSNRIEVKYD
jgi:osmotically-inducible protein OsmY